MPIQRADVVRRSSGQGEIRTHDTVAGMPVFETGAFNHSATCPGQPENLAGVRRGVNETRRAAAPRRTRASSAPHSASQHAAHALPAMIQSGMPQEIADRARHARLVDPTRRTRHASMRASTIAPAHIAHGSSVTYSVQSSSRHASERTRRLADREQLGVRGGVLIAHRAIGRARDDLAIAHDHRADRHVAGDARRTAPRASAAVIHRRSVARAPSALIGRRARGRSRRPPAPAPALARRPAFSNVSAPPRPSPTTM